MIRSNGMPAPVEADVLAAAGAGVAEGAVLCLPVRLILTSGGATGLSLVLFVPLFLVAFGLAAALMCRFREVRVAPLTAAITAIVVGALIGRGIASSVAPIVVFLLLAARAVTLGFRDWETPIALSFVAGATAMAVESAVAASGWGVALDLLMPVFFAASLGSRAISVWSRGDARELTGRERDRSLRRALAGTGWLVVAMAAAVGLGVGGGVLDRLGSMIAVVGDALAPVFVFVLSLILRPIFWLVDHLHVDPEKFRRLLDRLRRSATRARRHATNQVGHHSSLGRLVGLALFVLAVWGLVRLIRRLRPSPVTAVEGVGVGIAASRPLEPGEPADATRWARRGRREPPADRVRRWYGEALAALAGRGLAKEDAATPAEFAPEVASAYPECGEGFAALTRAYEDVRYGGLRVDRQSLRRLEDEQRRLLHAVRRRLPDRREPLSP